jgi:DNA polymerase family A
MSIRDFIARHSAPAPVSTRIPSIPPPALILPIDLPDELSLPIIYETTARTAEYNPFFYWDVETRSAAQLAKGKESVGARAYAEHPTTEVLCVAFARGNGPVQTWLPGEPIPAAVFEAAADLSCRWVAHNAAFERAVVERILSSQHGWPIVPVERWVCTMALALSHAYPGGLEAAADALGLVNKKDVALAKEVAVMWKPRKPKRGEDPNVLHWVDTPELRLKLQAYNRQDVVTERELHQRLQALPPAEQEVWVVDAEINDLGVHIDAPLGTAAAALTIRALADLNEQLCRVTGGAVEKTTKVQELKKWLALQGVVLPRRPKKKKGGTEWEPCLEEDDIARLLAGELPLAARTALEIRLQAAQSAVSKFARMLKTRCADGRVRNLYRVYGTVTGRWSGEGFQPQNLKRPEHLHTDEAIAEAIGIVLAGNYEAAKARYPDLLGVLGDLSRSMLIPAPGCRFIVGDYSTIEARVLALLAGDTAKLARFRDFDAGIGRDLYCIAAEEVLGLAHVASSSPQRQLGKVFELGLGYQMGPDRLLTTIRKARLPDMENITETDTDRWVTKWRAGNPAIVAFWATLDAAARSAVRHPGITVPCRLVSFLTTENVLRMRLPSGRELSYPAPRIAPGRFGKAQVVFTDMEAGRRRGRQVYGGMWAENVTSAVARDLLVEAMKRLRAAGYRLALHTHDEVVAEMPIGQGGMAEFKQLLIAAPAWIDSSLPIAAKVFECARFKKD